MANELLIQPDVRPCVVSLRMEIQRRFKLHQDGRRSRGKFKIKLAAFQNAFRGCEEKSMISADRASQLNTRVVAHEERNVSREDERRVGRVNFVVSMKEGSPTVPSVATGFGKHIDDATGAMAELRRITGGEHLEFENRVLVELRCRAAIDFVAIGHAIHKEHSIAAALSENRSGRVHLRVLLAIDGYPRYKLQQIQIVSSVDGHVGNLSRHDGVPRGGCGTVE